MVQRELCFVHGDGTGKSKVLIDNIAMLYKQDKINFAVVIAPKGVYRNWSEIEIPHMPDGIKRG